ncbi:hypothetical protein K0M31_012948 [Melipona bicolor]|uniref:Uncharacterized protein n=1 Tax=Melipona bicolor TaxID=60889 RepID=A0AA40FJ03_9HYME|nr:hypothetical protein K0M31_012948 [Melipona bicolor]
MTYITNGLQERASASSWRCLHGSFMLGRGGKWRVGGRRRRRRRREKRVRQSPLPLHANIPAVLRLYRESREKRKKWYKIGARCLTKVEQFLEKTRWDHPAQRIVRNLGIVRYVEDVSDVD